MKVCQQKERQRFLQGVVNKRTEDKMYAQYIQKQTFIPHQDRAP